MPSQVDRAAAADNAQAEQELSCDGCPNRSAFGDMTNAHKPLQKQQKKEVAKKASETTPLHHVTDNNGHILKKPPSKASFEETQLNSDHFAKKGATKDKEEEIDHSLTSVVSVDNNDQLDNFYANCEYAMDIFIYMREREKRFLLRDYMNYQPDITKKMWAILVDWMVEVQANFELLHETLYLAVKLLDHFLAKITPRRNKLQLIGSTAIFIASKFEDRDPPRVDEILYICDYAYSEKRFLSAEKRMLKVLKYDINIPIANSFLRQYAKYTHVDMETLTLARFICELTLQDYDFAQDIPSQLASVCLLLAFKMKKLGGWDPILEHCSGYKAQELYPLVKKLNFMLTYRHDEKLKSVRSKYYHRVFFEVAKISPMDMLKLEEALQS
ncbi:G2/mitotic-specific cyclin-B3-like [Zootoca vivipara]|uniref:G2/mitotic-specific cyclin-B3-like n=1 Tax=Zootoca vivipara TaxID=8524 RepID=UPI00293BEE55|nr:G2/mitotic-specific cyclin-B3-like [Zootoca vivipara]